MANINILGCYLGLWTIVRHVGTFSFTFEVDENPFVYKACYLLLFVLKSFRNCYCLTTLIAVQNLAVSCSLEKLGGKGETVMNCLDDKNKFAFPMWLIFLLFLSFSCVVLMFMSVVLYCLWLCGVNFICNCSLWFLNDFQCALRGGITYLGV